MQLNEDINTAADEPVWALLGDAGIDLDLVSVDPAGDWELVSGDTRVCFGYSESTEPDVPSTGWDWTRYIRNDEDTETWDAVAQDWAETDEALISVLKATIAGA